MKRTYLGITSIVILVITAAILLGTNGKHFANSTTSPTPSPTNRATQTPTSNENKKNDSPSSQIDDNMASMSAITTEDGLIIEDLEVGTGTEATEGKTVTVNYVGTLTNNVEFDSSYSRNQPFSFSLGAGRVIEGWDKGVVGMKVGGKRKLTIPPELGYGSTPQGPIPANSTLIFEIELLDVE